MIIHTMLVNINFNVFERERKLAQETQNDHVTIKTLDGETNIEITLLFPDNVCSYFF